MQQAPGFPLPPVRTNASGEIRRVGVELEFTGLSLADIVRLIREQFGGSVVAHSVYEHTVIDTSLGDFKVELDFQYLKNKGRCRPSPEDAFALFDDWSEFIVRMAAEQIVPFEIVSPPIPMDRLSELGQLIGRLREFGAQGTHGSALNAFGLHFNPELPSLDQDTIVCYLKAFLCLYDWLVQHSQIDLTRSMTGYIAPFPSAYIRQVIDPDYRPNLNTLIDDYLIANPTRNRALDMLPLFCYLDRDRTLSVIDDERVHPRPTLHYRLPNCRIDEPGWNLDADWRNWLAVEQVATNRACLDALCRAYAAFMDRPFAEWFQEWKDTVPLCLRQYCGL